MAINKVSNQTCEVSIKNVKSVTTTMHFLDILQFEIIRQNWLGMIIIKAHDNYIWNYKCNYIKNII